MNKKLVSLVLVFMIIFSFVLSSCSILSSGNGEDSDTGEEEQTDLSNRTPVTLTLWLPALEGTTEKAVAEVETEINKILKPMYTTAVEFRTIPEDQYTDAVYAQIQKIQQKLDDDDAAVSVSRELEQSRRLDGITDDKKETEEVSETVVETLENSFGQSEKRYPSVGEYQFDIFLVTSYDMYLDLIEKEAIMDLEDSLKSTGKVLPKYIYPSFLEAARFEFGDAYAIPNNHGMGEYRFLLTNKELINKYHYDVDTLLSMADCEDFIRDVAEGENDKALAPLLSWVEPAGMHYWSEDGKWSVLASYIGSKSEPSAQSVVTDIFSIPQYRENFKLMKSLEEDGLIAEDPDSVEKFAVGVVSAGSLDEVEELYGEEYNITVFDYPKATQEELFDSAFAVSAATRDLTRCMEVITAINTQPELRNLIQYGVEGVHYNRDDDNRVVRVRDENGNAAYNMDIAHTGNTYIAYPEEGMSDDQWERDMERNLDSCLTPFSFCSGLYNESNKANYEEIAKLSADLYDRMMKVSADEVDQFFAAARKELIANEKFTQMTGMTWEYGTAYIYNTFYATYYATDEPGDDTGEAGAETGDAGEAGGEAQE